MHANIMLYHQQLQKKESAYWYLYEIWITTIVVISS